MEQEKDEKIMDLVTWMKNNLYHFSSKTINSNAQPTGVRVHRQRALDLPYVSVRTLLSENADIGLDYLVNANASATHFKRLRQLLGEIPDSENTSPQQQKTVKQSYTDLLDHPAECNTETVSPRLRQLLIPKGDDYVAITPLGSAGLCEKIRSVTDQRAKENKEAQALNKDQPKNDKRTLPHGYEQYINRFSVGGSNPQNVGGRVRSMSRPIVFWNIPSPPTQEARTALSLHFKGFRPKLPRELVQNYYDWFIKQERRGKELLINRRKQDEEAMLIRALLVAIDRQARAKATLLKQYDQPLPSTKSATATAFSNGWLDPHQRTPAWRKDVAEWLVSKLADYRLSNPCGTDPLRFGLTHEDMRRLKKLLEAG